MIGPSRLPLNPPRATWALVSLLLILGAWWGLAGLDDGLETRSFTRDGVPLRFMALKSPPADGQPRPGVIVAHGFSVAQQIMLGYGYSLSRAGYAVLMLDFAGHGRNPQPLNRQGDDLQDDLDSAYQALVNQPGVDRDRIALLGQSMGSGAVMTAGINHPERYRAVVAVSPTGADVDESHPPNLMLQAGQLEGSFVANAQDLLARAGGPSEDFAAGTARAFVEITNVEHISILFSGESQAQARLWLDRAFGLNTTSPYRERRFLYYCLNLAGWLGLALAVAPLVSGRWPTQPQRNPRRGPWQPWLGLVAGSLLAPLFLALLARAVEISGLLGQAVGGALALWFAVMGFCWLLVGFRPILPGLPSLLKGLALFGLLWLALGLAAQFTVIQWFLSGPRLALWPVLFVACLPWQLAAGYAPLGGDFKRRVAWWAAHCLVLITGLLLTAFVTPGMFFLVLMAPVVPLVLAAISAAAAALDDPWVSALGGALFMGWLLAAVFPLV